MGIARIRTWLAIAAAFIALIGSGKAIAADAPTCDSILTGDGAPTISRAYNHAYKPGAVGADTIALGSIVTVEGNNLDKLFDKACANKVVVLFLDDRPMLGVTRDPPTSPADKLFHFTLRRGEDTRESWLPILGSARFTAKDVRVSVGFKDGYAIKSTNEKDTTLKFDVIPTGWFLLWGAIFLLMTVTFFILAHCSNIVRDPAPIASGAKGTYSLSRIQGAIWFFVIVAAYLFIGIITGDFSNSVNSTALILLGIGAGTVLGSAAIDAQKDTAQQKADTTVAINNVNAQIKAAEDEIADLKTKVDAATGADKIALQSQKAEADANRENLLSQLRKLYGQSECLITDILSDANGISFHRFQIASWTLVLSIIFVVDVWQNLAMPTFNTTLMGMLGLSAGTYLGLKIPEPTTPTTAPPAAPVAKTAAVAPATQAQAPKVPGG